MLILTRQVGESIIIGEKDSKIVFSLLGIKGPQAKIGITVPKSINISKEKVYRQIQKNLLKDKFSEFYLDEVTTDVDTDEC